MASQAAGMVQLTLPLRSQPVSISGGSAGQQQALRVSDITDQTLRTLKIT